MGTYRSDLIKHLAGFVTPERFALFQRVLKERTRYITVLLEDIYQPQNASAVLRTCDCLGIQDLYIVEKRNRYEINPEVTLGSDQWLSIHYYNDGTDDISKSVKELRSRGYRIVATSPRGNGTTPESFEIEKGKVAVMFGTELNGLTPSAIELADEYIRIPMVGFTESLNISVSAAVILYRLRRRLEETDLHWELEPEEREEILLDWLKTSVKMSEQIERKFRKEYHSTF